MHAEELRAARSCDECAEAIGNVAALDCALHAAVAAAVASSTGRDSLLTAANLSARPHSSPSNFIDVSAKSGQLDEDDLVERGQKYVKNLSEIPSPSAVQQAAQPSVSALSFGRYYSALDLPLPSSAVVKRPQAPPSSALGAGLHAHAALPAEVDYQTLLAVLAAATVPLHDLEFVSPLAHELPQLDGRRAESGGKHC